MVKGPLLPPLPPLPLSLVAVGVPEAAAVPAVPVGVCACEPADDEQAANSSRSSSESRQQTERTVRWPRDGRGNSISWDLAVSGVSGTRIAGLSYPVICLPRVRSITNGETPAQCDSSLFSSAETLSGYQWIMKRSCCKGGSEQFSSHRRLRG